HLGATRSSGQVIHFVVCSNARPRPRPTLFPYTTLFRSLGTTLTFTGGGPNSHTVAVSTINDTVVEGSEDYTVTIGGQTAGTITRSEAHTTVLESLTNPLFRRTLDSSNAAA